jgi:hypothetical protein
MEIFISSSGVVNAGSQIAVQVQPHGNFTFEPRTASTVQLITKSGFLTSIPLPTQVLMRYY